MDEKRIDWRKEILRFLGKGGVLAREFSGYEYREEQVRMAEAVYDILHNGGVLLVEAGTGTGKTLAYLLPALLSNQRVVISTGTKTLQDQIFNKDLPVLRKHFQFRAMMMKGRGNYLCLRRFHRFFRQPSLGFIGGEELLERIRLWAEGTKSGDREELIEISDGHPVWDRICSERDSCLGTNCVHFKECFITELKGRAQLSDIIVVNHHLFFADLSVRMLGFGEVIPRYKAVIFDEAHLLEDIITEYFGVSITDRMILELASDLKENLSELKRVETKELSGIAERVENLTETVFSGLRRHFKGLTDADEARRVEFKIENLPLQLVSSGKELVRELSTVSGILAEKREMPELLGISERAGRLSSGMDFVLRQDERGFVFYSEIKPKSLLLRGAPIEVSGILRDIFYPNIESVIFTSATLTVSKEKKPSFDYYKSRMGLDNVVQLKELWLKSSFNFSKQALLFIPRDISEPDAPGFITEAVKVVEKLLEISQGRAFLLFTSYRNLEAFYEALGDRLPYPVLRQGDKPRSELLKEFREIEESVLFATTSFWQGVDVAGPALSLVVIDRLPFDSPGDPLVKARIGFINESGGRAFFDYQVPSAVIMLKQGLGRLIRSNKDRGVMCVLDIRIRRRNYGRIFLNSLPDIPVTERISDVAEFFSKEKDFGQRER